MPTGSNFFFSIVAVGSASLSLHLSAVSSSLITVLLLLRGAHFLSSVVCLSSAFDYPAVQVNGESLPDLVSYVTATHSTRTPTIVVV